MDNPMKKLTRIQLVNWHFFENERICLNGSTLISGENTAGKSTILDALQLVLTTNSRKFNMAANEKGNRDLKGYVRCKVGNVGETYHRKGTVPGNVALELYDEKTDNYFVIGVHLLSTDEESPVIKKWYCEECRLEDLSFITDGRPSLAEELRNKTRRIKYMDTDKAARDRFRHRMGNLDEKFFDIIPKSLAFKPMDNVKDFINKFVLSEGRVDVESLKENISLLDELENTLNKTKRQLDGLNSILSVFDEIDDKNRDIKVNEILLGLAEKDALESDIEKQKEDLDIKTQTVSGIEDRVKTYDNSIKNLDEEIVSLNVSISNNESSKLVESLGRRRDSLTAEIKNEKVNKKNLENETAKLIKYLRGVNNLLNDKVDGQEEMAIILEAGYESEKTAAIRKMSKHFDVEYQEFIDNRAQLNIRMRELDDAINKLTERQISLEKRQLSYPKATSELKKLIEQEYVRKGIDSEVYILSELLEITDEKWRNAVEGYLNTQKFYLIVEPEYVNTALEVYDRNRSRIHSAGVINTRKLPMDYVENSRSLAYVVKSENRYARSYIEYILGRVIRCENVLELEDHKIAITPECMLYQGYVVRHINPRDYENPFIGINAYRVQLENTRKELEDISEERKGLRQELYKYNEIVSLGRDINLDMIKLYMNSPTKIKMLESELTAVKAELKTAEKDRTLMELMFKLEEKSNSLQNIKVEKEAIIEEKAKLSNQIDNLSESISTKSRMLEMKQKEMADIYEQTGTEYKLASDKYQRNRRSKEPQKIYDNYSPQRTQFENEKNNLIKQLYGLQSDFNAEFSFDFTTGTEEASQYREAADKLARVEIVKYEEKLRTARRDCESIFRSDFLSKMKEHIERAKQEFRNLNKALENVYYGEDSYHFNITFDKRKESLYKMITSEYNMEGENNLWTSAFEEEYKDEIEDLFAKLMVGDDKGEKVIEEYTDYRSYLDYDIEIRKKNGQRQRFSDIYGEKSGSETQVPYYVAIAASFYQLYRYGNSVRLMLLDEAFDKMDDDRIKSMLEFMNDLRLQVIMATPPSKIEIIGEQVGCILTAIREGNRSIVEEYEL